MSRKKKNHSEQDPTESDAAERRPIDDAECRDESPPSDSSRHSSGGDPGDVSGYLADEIGALDSMRHENAHEIVETGLVEETDAAEDQDRSGSSEDVDEPRDGR